jgi:hypothetical protein
VEKLVQQNRRVDDLHIRGGFDVVAELHHDVTGSRTYLRCVLQIMLGVQNASNVLEVEWEVVSFLIAVFVFLHCHELFVHFGEHQFAARPLENAPQ